MEKNDSNPNHLFRVPAPASVAGPSLKVWERLESLHALNDVVRGIFDEKMVSRIDQYLGKETVQNILVFRFSNSLFEPVWKPSARGTKQPRW